jgi:hypothetical protein
MQVRLAKWIISIRHVAGWKYVDTYRRFMMGLLNWGSDKYRVVRKFKKGYYDIYSVQHRTFFIVWDDIGRSFNNKEEAFNHIRLLIDNDKPETITVEKEDVQ